MKVKPTAEQALAINSQGETLVSASAGSGKTFVMIEKIISLILQGKAEISGVLAVTFTNLAATEMKEKLKRAIIKRINEEKDGEIKARLKYELLEIGTADICTLHSFCANVIRKYFYFSDDNGDFKIADEADAAEMKKRAAEITIDTLIERQSENFSALLKIFAGSKGTDKLISLILPLYEKIRVYADYKTRLKNMPLIYCKNGFEKITSEYFSSLKKRIEIVDKKAEELLDETEYFILRDEMSEKYEMFLQDIQVACWLMEKAENLYACAEVAAKTKLASKPSNAPLKRAENIEALALDEKIDALKTYFKDILSDLKPFENSEQDLFKFLSSGKICSAVCEMLLLFDETYSAIKKRAGKLDFSDLEHHALNLLQNKFVNGELKKKYTHIFVDEYQDVNPCQETILKLLQCENTFRVGDAKQSIYGFRGCSAKFFTEEFDKLKKISDGALVLNGNFRSAPQILNVVNAVFSEVMTEETCRIDYKNTSMMTAGNAYPKDSGEVWFDFVPEKEENEKPRERNVYSVIEKLDFQNTDTDEEGAYIADIIAHEMEKSHFDVSIGEYVKNDFKDIVILSRSKTGRASKIISELIKRGIPVASAAEYNICEYPEIKRLIEILKYLDNAEQDIPLAAALKSSICSLTDSELAKIRLFAGNKHSFVSACEKYANETDDELSIKLKDFYVYTKKLRLLSNVKSSAEILTALISEKGVEIDELRRENGEERIKRIDRFISWCGDESIPDVLKRLKNSGYNIGFLESGGENAVRVMTMHASKGLEFPVVILAGMDNRFDDSDFKEKILLDDEYGFAPLYYNENNFTASETVLRALIKERMIKRRAEDEMRLLYVAATRAQYCMHFVFKKCGEFDFLKVSRASKFSDFINLSKMQQRFSQLDEKTIDVVSSRPLIISETDKDAEREILKLYQKPYRYENSLNIRVKSSASAVLKEQGESYYAENELFPEMNSSPIDVLTGTAYHAFLERADFNNEPKYEAKRVYKLMSEKSELFERLNLEKMQKILAFSVFKLLSGYTLYKEQEFLLSVPAFEIYQTDSDDSVIIQGFIDLLAVKGDSAIIIDYKYSSHSNERLVKDYQKQLEIYAKAVKNVLKIKNISAFIVNINKLSTVEIPIK